jgi:hypothetical protein
MKPFPAREVDAALLRKGFVKRQGDQAYYHFNTEAATSASRRRSRMGEKKSDQA